jgi:hypothetical protein
MRECCFTFRKTIGLSCIAQCLALAVFMHTPSDGAAEDQQSATQEQAQQAQPNVPASNKAETQEAPPDEDSDVRVIGATTIVTEVSTGVPLPARVDTGATSCSIHCEAIEIEDANPNPRENIGKPVRFLVRYGGSEGKWVESKIVDHVVVRTSERDDERYKVKLQLRWEDVEKKVVATLNDRQRMKYPMLLGRNFLRDDFLVNVSMDATEATE